MKDFDEDAYMAREVDKHLAQQEMAELVSNCCGEPIEDETDICSGCGEHCSPVEFGDYMHDMRVAYEEDAADAKHDLERDR